MIVNLEDFAPGARYDGTAYVSARLEEASASNGPWTALETVDLAAGANVSPMGLDLDPSDPQSRSFTTELATLVNGWYRVVWVDPTGDTQASPAIYNDGEQVYASIQAVRRVLSPDGSREAALGTAASLSNGEIGEAIEEAAAEINARIASRYSLPFSAPVPSLLEKLNRDIAAFLATLVYRRNAPLPAEDPVRLRYARAQALLDRVARGEVELTTATGLAGESAETEVINLYEGDMFSLDEAGLSASGVTWPWAPGY